MDPLIIMLLLGAGAMFLLSNRSKKQQRKAVEFRSNLQPGDEVMTGSGLFGTVVAVDGDVITLESPSGGQTDWLRAAISKLATPPYAAVDDADDADGDEAYEDEAYDDEEPYEDEDSSEDQELDEVEADARPDEDLAETAPDAEEPARRV